MLIAVVCPYLEFSAAPVPEKCAILNCTLKFIGLCLPLGAHLSFHCCIDQSPRLSASILLLQSITITSTASSTVGHTLQAPLNATWEALQLSEKFDCSRIGPLWLSRISNSSWASTIKLIIQKALHKNNPVRFCGPRANSFTWLQNLSPMYYIWQAIWKCDAFWEAYLWAHAHKKVTAMNPCLSLPQTYNSLPMKSP